MNRALAVACLSLAYIAARPYISDVTPTIVPVVPLPPDTLGLNSVVQGMSADDRTALRETYATLSRAVADDTSDEPVFATTGAVRSAHRAALHVVWKGAMNNNPGKYPGLREGIERVMADEVGMDDVAMSPALRSSVSQTFDKLSKAF